MYGKQFLFWELSHNIFVKVLLDSGATGIFISKQLTDKQEFKLKKLPRPIKIRNMDGTNNSGRLVTHKVEVNIYFKEHVEQV